MSPQDAPPPYYNTPPPTKSKFPAWAGVLLGCGCVGFVLIPILAAIIFPVFAKGREQARTNVCMSNEKQMSLALLQYTQDYDENLPSSATWMDATQPYTKQDFHCPDVATAADSNQYGYAFDSRLSQKPFAEIASPKTTTMVYDSDSLERNASDPGTSAPNPGRHSGGNNYAMADGHVQWLRSAAVTQASP